MKIAYNIHVQKEHIIDKKKPKTFVYLYQDDIDIQVQK